MWRQLEIASKGKKNFHHARALLLSRNHVLLYNMINCNLILRLIRCLCTLSRPTLAFPVAVVAVDAGTHHCIRVQCAHVEG